MKTPNPDQPIRNTLKHLALGAALGISLPAPASAAPPVTTGLRLHLDASTLGLNDNDPVPAWTDVSGQGNHATATGTPIYKTNVLNGQPVVRFDNASSFTTADLSAQFPSAVTGFIVTTINNDNAYTLVKANPGVDEWWRWNGNGQSYPGFFRGNRLENYTAMPDSGTHLFAISSSASAWEMSINGVSRGVAGANFNSGGALIIGNGSTGGGLNGDIAEILIYDSVLSASDADLVGAYLTAKYLLSTTYGPPLILNFTPPDGGTTATDSNLVVTFNKPITIGTGDITIKNLTNTTQTVITLPDPQVTVSGAVLTINPDLDLEEGDNYAVQIAAGAIASFAGILDDTTWNFAAAAATPTTIAVVTSGSPSIYGDSVTFTATVTPVPSGGTVQFYNGLFTTLGSPVAVNTTTGEATFTTSTLGVVGPNDINAVYSGNFQFAGSESASITQVVNKAELTVTAQNVFRFPNTTNPDPLPFVITGFQNGQTLGTSGVTGTPDLSTTADEASPIATYDIICAVGSLAADNYSFAVVDATLSVVPVTSLAINVNLDRSVRLGLEGPAGGLGAVWNTISATSATNLSVASGPASTVGFTSSGTGGWGNPGESANFDPTLRLLKEGSTNFGANGTTQQLVITGLDPAKTYDLSIASAILITTNQRNRGEWSTTNTTSTVGSQEVDNRYVDPNDTLSGNGQNHTTWVQGNNYVRFEDVVPDGSGNITVNGFAITEQPTFDIRLALNGFQLVENVATGGGFDAWASANGATGQTPQQDHDNDGVSNGIEFFMGETGSSFTATPGLNAANEISWPASAAYVGTYEVQTSPDLATWINVDPRPVPVAGILSYTLPPGAPGGKSFVRLLVTPTP